MHTDTHTQIHPSELPALALELRAFEYCAVFDTILVDAHEVQSLCVTGGGAGHPGPLAPHP